MHLIDTKLGHNYHKFFNKKLIILKMYWLLIYPVSFKLSGHKSCTHNTTLILKNLRKINTGNA